MAYVLRFSCRGSTPAPGAVGPDGCPLVIHPAPEGLHHQKPVAIRSPGGDREGNRTIFWTAVALGRFIFDGHHKQNQRPQIKKML